MLDEEQSRTAFGDDVLEYRTEQLRLGWVQSGRGFVEQDDVERPCETASQFDEASLT